MTRAEVRELICDCLAEWNAGAIRRIPLERGEDAPLYDKEGILDSIGLVALLVGIDQEIEARFGVTLDLANETNALSRKDTPFRTARTLTDYVWELLSLETADRQSTGKGG